ncbi:hypothetical protein pb186bvf_016062 [Paramecium bursaria]
MNLCINHGLYVFQCISFQHSLDCNHENKMRLIILVTVQLSNEQQRGYYVLFVTSIIFFYNIRFIIGRSFTYLYTSIQTRITIKQSLQRISQMKLETFQIQSYSPRKIRVKQQVDFDY